MAATIYEKMNKHVKREPGEMAILTLFESERFEGWTVFEEPHVNSMKPDFIAFHPRKGILIIEVKDYDLSSPTYLPGGYVMGENGHRIKKNPVQQVEHYRDSLLKNELRSSVEFAEVFAENNHYYSCVETILYFHNASKQQAKVFCGYPRYTKIWTREDLTYISNPFNRITNDEYTYALKLSYSKFTRNGQLEKMTKELEILLSYSDYGLERSEKVLLSAKQKKCVAVKHGKSQIYKGVAGSGKTLILVEKALQAIREGHRVIISTFNITLRHYIRDLCSQQCDDRQLRKRMKSHLTILHFHDLLKTLLAEADVDRPINSDGGFTAEWIAVVERDVFDGAVNSKIMYDTILLDEGQDFLGDWQSFLKQLFTGNGEFSVFCDAAQDLYGHSEWLTNNEFIKMMDFKQKPIELKESYRLPKKMIEKIETAKILLQMPGEPIGVAKINEQGSLFEKCQFINTHANNIDDKLQQIGHIVGQIQQSNPIEDITILTTNEQTGAEIVKFFQRHHVRVSHVYDLQGNGDLDVRRKEKWRFQGGTGRLKVCSYHSYKGWETPNVLLVLDPPSTQYNDDGTIRNTDPPTLKAVQHAIFIAMSRVKGKKTDGAFYFLCLNYILTYKTELQSLNDDLDS